MAVTWNDSARPRLTAAALAPWRDMPTAVISDELNRAGTMDAAIKPVAPGMRFAAEAFTVQTMVGDNSTIHYAVPMAPTGSALIVDGRGFLGTALWGDVLNHLARKRGLAAVVVDGAVRDAAELRQAGLPVFARGVVPTGPHKGWGGAINAPIQCGGCAVAPGDLVVGDDDGVVVVPRDRLDAVLAGARARLAAERETHAQIEAGKTTAELLKLPPLPGR